MENIPALFVFSIGSALIAILGFALLRKLPKKFNVDEDQNFLDAMLSIVGTLVSIVIGLLVAFALDHYQSVEQSVDSEASNISQIYRLTSGLDTEPRKQIRALCSQYNKQVLEAEWPAMEHGEFSKEAFATYAKLMTAIAEYRPSNDGESNLHAALISSCQEIGNGRRMRMLVVHSNWVNHIMPMLVMCAIIVLIFAFLYIRKGAPLQIFLLGLVALALGGNLGLVYLLSNPFSGDWQIAPRGFELNRKILESIESTPELKKILKYDDANSERKE